MSQETAIRFGTFSGFTWIRCEGKGSFLQSPILKECVEQARAAGESRFVIDLEDCSGMDSTFMGYLAGLASRLSKNSGGVEVAAAGDRNRRSLENLGLDCLLSIDPEDADWRGREEEIRDELKPFLPSASGDVRERARHVLESHQILAGTSAENAERFANVVKVLKEQVTTDGRDSDSR